MRHRLVFSSLPLLVVILALAPTVLASTTWYVNGVSGSDGNNCMSAQTACKTIGHAISLASSSDSIMVAAATYKENLTIGFSLGIVGSGANKTIINGGGVNTVVTIPNAGVLVIISGVAIRNGFVSGGSGGGIYNLAALTINNSTISGNHAAGIQHELRGAGGGIYNGGALTIQNSTLSRNRASTSLHGARSVGGGIANEGTLIISNSTFSENSARGGVGGGISNGGTLTINNSTLSGNSAATGGGIWNYDASPATLQNSIVANSPTGGNCDGTITSDGYNLGSDSTCNFNNLGDMNNTDPKLGPLQKNGGPTETQALLSGSPAIDAGNPSGCTDGQGHLLTTDQRGQPRPDKEDSGGCDMGAYESQKD
jgi:hypothetical protein